MADMHQEVKIKWGLGTPRLKGRLKPIIMAPVKPLIAPSVKGKLPLYINPVPLKPIILKAVEPPLKEQIDDVIPLYIGEPDGQQEIIREETVDDAPAYKDGETFTDFEDAPRTL